PSATRMSPSLALARRILAVGLFAGVLALLLVNGRGTPQSVTTTVNFDTPAPPGGPGPFGGVFEGIDFGTGQWAWTGPYDVGSTAGWSLGVDDITYSTAQGPSVSGQWSAVISWPIAPVHTLLQPSGEVLVWDRFNAGPGARIWNPNTGAFTVVPAASDLFCA